MSTDVTTLLIQMVTAEGNQTNGLGVNRSVMGSAADLLSLAANYAQILGTVEGPIAQAAAAKAVGEIAAEQAANKITAGAAAEATALAAAGTSFAGAIVVVFLSYILAKLTDSGQSDQAQQFQNLVDAVNTVTEVVLANYWLDKMTGSLSLLWSPVGTDLDNLAREGTGGSDVTTDVSHFHDHGIAFVNHLIKDPGSEQYWQVPAQPAGDIPQSPGPKPGWGTSGWMYESWYGQFPTRLTIAGSPTGNVTDPRTIAECVPESVGGERRLDSFYATCS